MLFWSKQNTLSRPNSATAHQLVFESAFQLPVAVANEKFLLKELIVKKAAVPSHETKSINSVSVVSARRATSGTVNTLVPGAAEARALNKLAATPTGINFRQA